LVGREGYAAQAAAQQHQELLEAIRQNSSGGSGGHYGAADPMTARAHDLIAASRARRQ